MSQEREDNTRIVGKGKFKVNEENVATGYMQ
jgi:hypothetical protein